MVNALYGARFKSWVGGQGLVSLISTCSQQILTLYLQAQNITWQNIRMSNVSYPIFVTSSYFKSVVCLIDMPQPCFFLVFFSSFSHFSFFHSQGSAQTQIQQGAVSGRPNNSTVLTAGFKWENITGTINTNNPGDGSCVTDPVRDVFCP
jgi:hypothetical protein